MADVEVIDAPTTEGDPPHSLVPTRPVERSAVLLMPVMNVQTAMVRLREFQGVLLQLLTGERRRRQRRRRLLENWETGLFDYSLTCLLKARRDDSVVGSGVGSCSSYESKYRWRESQRLCPQCGKPAIIKGRQEYGGGWVCFDKKGGCKAKFKDGDKDIEGQSTGRVENPDIADSKNTVLKMAKKRAKIDAVIGVTRSSGIFTQDMEDAHAAAPVAAPSATTTDAPPPNQAAAAGPRPTYLGNYASGPQGKRLAAIARSAGWSEAELSAFLAKKSIPDLDHIPKQLYESICKAVEQGSL